MSRDAGKEELQVWLGRSTVSNEIKNRAFPLLELLSRNDIKTFEQEFFRLFRDVIVKLHSQAITPKEIDDIFMLLFLFITEHDLDNFLSKDVQGLLYEGVLFHDFGTQFGPNLKWVEQILRNNGK